ncbi:MAG: hypothetical protein J6Y59_05780 [Bacteroidaceae bacterium]|nr:hypothetical protein [Bacteroidaceae bacterium]
MKDNNKHKDEALRIAIEHKMRTCEESRLSDDFVEHLMQHIEGKEKTTEGNLGNTWLRVISNISTVAAVMLVAYFITLHLPLTKKTEQTYTYYNIASLPKSSTLEQVYTSHSGQKKSHQLSYTHFKRMIYEHK